MNSGTIDLIATDPPFNKGRDFHATPDSLAAGAKFQDRWSWEKDVHEEWIDQISDDYPKVMLTIENARVSYGDDMGAFLCFIAVRLIAMKRLLKDTGSIYLHCDPTASHYLKMLMDGVFGKDNFRNEIIWHYSNRWPARANKFQKNHDVILCYSKTGNATFNPVMIEGKRIKRDVEKGWGTDTIRSGSIKRIRVYNKDKVDKAISQGILSLDNYNLVVDQTHKTGERPCSDVWDINLINPMSKERMGYPTQKPLELYERIIKASSNEGDTVLDPFAGCATTCVAAERLGRKWVGIDLWDKAHDVIIKRFEKENLTVKGNSSSVFSFAELYYIKELPERTDDGEIAVPYLRPKVKIKEPPGPKMTRQEMYEYLLGQDGYICQGCERKFDDSRYLELDHKNPRADGGINHISNRILLCSPCNRVKSHILTLSGLRKKNEKEGWMAHK